MSERLNALKDFLASITDNFSLSGIIIEILDLLIFLTILFLLLRKIKAKFNVGKIVLFIILYCALLVGTYLLDFFILFNLLKYLIVVAIVAIIVFYKEEFRLALDKSFHISQTQRKNVSAEEKNQIIDTLVSTAFYLGERKTGALIVIEGQESLDSYINKSIVIKSVITQELLTTLFYVGTATHDGAVIIRNNTIMCAGAYLPSTDRYDIPKALGTRHRAAIGLSEKCDALTIVVSEETGLVSITRNGGIDIGIDATQVRKMLEEHYNNN